jgi:hypothetical protein
MQIESNAGGKNISLQLLLSEIMSAILELYKMGGTKRLAFPHFELKLKSRFQIDSMNEPPSLDELRSGNN